MSHVSEDKIEVIKVELSREDVLVAVVAHARELVTKNPVRFTTVDEEWAPQIVKNEYGGYIVMFRKKVEDRAAVGKPLQQQDFVAQVGR